MQKIKRKEIKADRSSYIQVSPHNEMQVTENERGKQK